MTSGRSKMRPFVEGETPTRIRRTTRGRRCRIQLSGLVGVQTRNTNTPHQDSPISHPCETILDKPSLGKHVKRLTESGSLHRSDPYLTRTTLLILPHLTSLTCFKWIDDSASPETNEILLSILVGMKEAGLPVREVVLQTHGDLEWGVWKELLRGMSGLEKVAIWCMEGPPKGIFSTDEKEEGEERLRIGDTLMHLELGVSAFSLPCDQRAYLCYPSAVD